MANAAAQSSSEPTPRYELTYETDRIVDFNNLDLFANGQPVAIFHRLQREAPVYWQPSQGLSAPGYWNITRYADIRQVSIDKETFTSTMGYRISHPLDGYERFRRARFGNLVAMDPPKHSTYRRIITPPFLNRALSQHADAIRGRVTRLIDDVAGKGHCDFVEALAKKLPIWTIAHLLGVPEEDIPLLLEATDMAGGAEDPELVKNLDEAADKVLELFEYGRRALEDRRRNPREDLLTAIATATVSDETLSAEELDGFVVVMVIAGNETTRNTISGGMWELCQNPAQKQLLIDSPARIPNAVEEMLRRSSVVNHMCRTPKKDIELGGQRIAAGERIAMWYGAANHDPSVFPEPETFDISRANADQHLAFGIGIHKCIGAQLARMQVNIFFEELLRRLPDIRAVEPPRRTRSILASSIKRFPVAFTPA
jgi:linalool 8-monooxygenase